MGPIVAAIQFVATIAAANTIRGLIVRTLLIAGAKMLFQALTPKPKAGAVAASGVEQQRQSGEATPRAIALGWTIVAGSECALWASGDSDDNRYNTRVIAISDWPTTLQKVWVRGRELTFEGDINTGWFACNQYRSKSGAARLWMRFIKGDWNQAADAQLISYANANGSWTSEDRLRGVSALLIRREYDVDAFQSGAPDNDDLRVEVKNAPVYDWRDVTQSLTDVTTWKPSENPVVLVENALCLLRAPAQYSPGSTDPIVGPGLDFSRRPLAKLTAMANICDELVSGQPRYRAGGVVRADMTGRDIIARFAAACAGSWVSSGEGGYLRPGYVPAPILDIPAGALQASSSDRFDPWARPDAVVNTVIGAYPDPSQGWQITPLPPATDSAWVASDGGVRAASEDLSFVPYREQAWRIATRKARGFRLMGSRDFTGPHWLIELEPGDVVTAPDPALPYLATKWWMVQRCVLLAKEDGLTCQITLNEIDSAIDAAPSAIGSPASFTPSSLARALAVPSVTIGQRLISAGSSGQFPELTFLIPDTAPQASGVVQLQGPSATNDTPSLAAAQIRNINLSRGLLVGEPVVPGWYRWRAAGRDVDGSVGAFDTTWQAAVQVTAPLVAGQAGTGIGGAPILNNLVPLGENQVVNSDLNQGLNGFEFVFASGTNLTGPGLSTNGGRNLVGSVPAVNYFGARNVFWSTASVSSGNFTGGTYLENFRQLGISGPSPSNLRRYATQVIPGERIYYSAKISVHGMTTAVAQVNFYDRDGAYLSTASTSAVIGDARTGGPNAQWGLPSNFATVGGFATVPANAVFAAMSTSGNTLNGAQPSVLVFSCDYFVAKVGADQTAIPAYNAGPVDRAADRTGENTAGGFLGQGNQATINRYRQSTAPSSPQEGDIWEDTSTTPVSYRKRMSGAWVFQGEEGADITAQAVPSVEGPKSISFDVDGAGALSPGSQVPRTLQFVRKRGNTDVSASTTWSIVSAVNVTLGTITNGGVNVTAVAAGLSNFTVRSVRDGVTIDYLVNVTKNTIAAGVVSATRKTVSTTNGTPNNGNWTDIASLVISNCPTGNLFFDSSFSLVTTGTGTCSHQARLTVDGVQVGSIQATQPTVTGGVLEAVDFSELFSQVIAVTAGSRTIAFQLQRTTGTGQITASNTRLDVAAFPG